MTSSAQVKHPESEKERLVVHKDFAMLFGKVYKFVLIFAPKS